MVFGLEGLRKDSSAKSVQKKKETNISSKANSPVINLHDQWSNFLNATYEATLELVFV